MKIKRMDNYDEVPDESVMDGDYYSDLEADCSQEYENFIQSLEENFQDLANDINILNYEQDDETGQELYTLIYSKNVIFQCDGLFKQFTLDRVKITLHDLIQILQSYN